jgi:hypothetical protein
MNKLVLVLAVACVAAGGYCGFRAGAFMNARAMQKEAIDQGFAQYNPKTGLWQWGVYIDSINLSGSLPKEMFLEPKKAGKK